MEIVHRLCATEQSRRSQHNKRKTTGLPWPTLEERCWSYSESRVRSTVMDNTCPSLLFHHLFSFLPSGKSYRVLETNTSSQCKKQLISNCHHHHYHHHHPSKVDMANRTFGQYVILLWNKLGKKISYLQFACQVKTWIFLNLLNNQFYYSSITTHPGYQQWCLHDDSGD